MRYFRYLLLTAPLAYVGGGFVFGFLRHTQSNSLFAQLSERVVSGVILAMYSSVYFGFPPQSLFGNIPPANVWPYIFATWIALVAIFWRYDSHALKR